MKETLKQRQMTYNSNWASKGGKIKSFNCPHCGKENQTPMPSKKDVSEKGFWDSLTTCYECNDLFMIVKYPNGGIELQTLQY